MNRTKFLEELKIILEAITKDSTEDAHSITGVSPEEVEWMTESVVSIDLSNDGKGIIIYDRSVLQAKEKFSVKTTKGCETLSWFWTEDEPSQYGFEEYFSHVLGPMNLTGPNENIDLNPKIKFKPKFIKIQSKSSDSTETKKEEKK